MKMLVTGGCGFIGCAFIRYIINNTSHTVVNVDKLTYASNESCQIYESLNARYSFYRADISDELTIDSILQHEGPDYVINFAAETHVDRSIDGPDAFFKSNIEGTYNLLKSSLKYWESLPHDKQQIFRYLQVSTDEVYGALSDEDASPFNESSPIRPSSPYSASKASGDNMVQAWFTTYGLPVIITRASNNYGPWQFLEKLIPVVINSITNQQPIPIYGDGKQQRNWMHVNDHVRGLYMILTQSEAGEIFNIGSDDELKNIDLVNILCRESASLLKVGAELPLSLITHVTDRKGHDFRYALSSEKLKAKLGWKPEITLQEGLADTVDWYIQRYLKS